jgi:hypothetical protein
VLGGSQQARKLLTKMGFRQIGQVQTYARVIRPWRQFLSRPGRRLARDLAKLVRNTGWTLTPKAPHGEWSAEPVDSFPESVVTLVAGSADPRYTFAYHSTEMLDFALRCPQANCRAFLLRERGETRGYFLLSRLAGQGRVADLRIASTADRDWAAAYSVALAAAAADPAACEVSAVSSTELTRTALAANGLQLSGERPIWFYDPRRLLVDGPALQLQAIESDAFFLYDPANPYVT